MHQPGDSQPRPGGVNGSGRMVDPDCTADERTYALMMHLSVLGHLLIPPFAIIAPIVMWQSKKTQSPFIDDHGREAVNFQISLLLYTLIFTVIGFVTCGLGWAVGALVYVLGLVGMILAATAANRGEFFRYPMTIRMLS